MQTGGFSSSLWSHVTLGRRHSLALVFNTGNDWRPKPFNTSEAKFFGCVWIRFGLQTFQMIFNNVYVFKLHASSPTPSPLPVPLGDGWNMGIKIKGRSLFVQEQCVCKTEIPSFMRPLVCAPFCQLAPGANLAFGNSSRQFQNSSFAIIFTYLWASHLPLSSCLFLNMASLLSELWWSLPWALLLSWLHTQDTLFFGSLTGLSNCTQHYNYLYSSLTPTS